MFKETLVSHFLNGTYNDLLKNEDTQKSIELNDDDSVKLKAIKAMLDRLETKELSFTYCRLCECILIDPNHDQDQPAADANATSPEIEPSPFTIDPDSVGENLDNPEAVGSPTVTNNLLLEAETANFNHLIAHVRENKQHKKICSDLGIKEIEDMCFSILSFVSSPGDISKELIKEKEKALKRKVKRQRMTLA